MSKFRVAENSLRQSLATDLVIPELYISLVIPENSVKLSRDLRTGTLFIPGIFGPVQYKQ